LIVAALLGIGLWCGVTASASQATERGRSIVNAALARLGGRERLQSIEYWTVAGRGRENLSADLQGRTPGQPTWRAHEEQIAIDARHLAVAWERQSARNDMSVRWRRMMLTAAATRFVDWVSGQSGTSSTPPAESRRRALARRIPHLLLLDAAASDRVRWKWSRRVRGILEDVVEVSLPEGTVIDLWIPRDGPLRGTEFRTALPGAGEIPVAWEWSGWRADAQLAMVPAAHTVTIDGVPFQEVTYSRFGLSAESPALLTAPDAASIRPSHPSADPPPPSALPATGDVAPGVFVANVGGFVVMSVEFADFVVAMEAPAVHPGFEGIPAQPGATRPSEEWLQTAVARSSGKPIRYLVVSHHHSDHLGGAAFFANDGATVLVPPGDRDAARRAAGSRARIEVISDRRIITDGTRSLEVLNVGDNPHTTGNLAVWLPRERIIFQGDLYYYNAGMPFPPSGRDAMNRFFSRWLRDRGIAPVAVYGVHSSGAAGPEALAISAR
jgi:glyoxylase-like metal-dependent hydrolase (beta-lactamase superfamily II)